MFEIALELTESANRRLTEQPLIDFVEDHDPRVFHTVLVRNHLFRKQLIINFVLVALVPWEHHLAQFVDEVVL